MSLVQAERRAFLSMIKHVDSCIEKLRSLAHSASEEDYNNYIHWLDRVDHICTEFKSKLNLTNKSAKVFPADSRTDEERLRFISGESSFKGHPFWDVDTSDE